MLPNQVQTAFTRRSPPRPLPRQSTGRASTEAKVRRIYFQLHQTQLDERGRQKHPCLGWQRSRRSSDVSTGNATPQAHLLASCERVADVVPGVRWPGSALSISCPTTFDTFRRPSVLLSLVDALQSRQEEEPGGTCGAWCGRPPRTRLASANPSFTVTVALRRHTGERLGRVASAHAPCCERHPNEPCNFELSASCGPAPASCWPSNPRLCPLPRAGD